MVRDCCAGLGVTDRGWALLIHVANCPLTEQWLGAVLVRRDVASAMQTRPVAAAGWICRHLRICERIFGTSLAALLCFPGLARATGAAGWICNLLLYNDESSEMGGFSVLPQSPKRTWDGVGVLE